MQFTTIYRFGMPFHVAIRKHILIPFQNDIRPLSNSVPEDVGKADQLKDEGKYHLPACGGCSGEDSKVAV